MALNRKARLQPVITMIAALALAVVVLRGLAEEDEKERKERQAAAEAFAARMANSLEGILLASSELAALPKEFIVKIEGGRVAVPSWLDRFGDASAFDPWESLDPIGREALRRAEQPTGAEAGTALEEFAGRDGVPNAVRDWALLGAAWARVRSGPPESPKDLPPLEAFGHPTPFASRLALAIRLEESIDAESALRSLPAETAKLVVASAGLSEARRAELNATIEEAERTRIRLDLVRRALADGAVPRRGIMRFEDHLLIRPEPDAITVLTLAETAELANRLVDVEVRTSKDQEPGWSPLALGGSLVCLVPDWADTAAAGNSRFFIALLLLAALMWGLWANSRAVHRERQAMAARSEFLTMVTHELKTPLTGIHVVAELLEGPRGAQEESRKRWLGRLRSECTRLGMLVQNVLDLGRSERGEQVHRPEVLDLGESVREVVHQFLPIAEQAQMQLTTEGLDQDLRVRADRDAIRQCLVNLLDNARKYAGDGAEVRVVMERRGDKATLSVIDDGPGVWPGERNRIFERFERGDAERTGTIPGLGIGLHLSKNLVVRDGGTLDLAEPKEGTGGACFTATWPVIETLEETA